MVVADPGSGSSRMVSNSGMGNISFVGGVAPGTVAASESITNSFEIGDIEPEPEPRGQNWETERDAGAATKSLRPPLLQKSTNEGVHIGTFASKDMQLQY